MSSRNFCACSRVIFGSIQREATPSQARSARAFASAREPYPPATPRTSLLIAVENEDLAGFHVLSDSEAGHRSELPQAFLARADEKRTATCVRDRTSQDGVLENSRIAEHGRRVLSHRFTS